MVSTTTTLTWSRVLNLIRTLTPWSSLWRARWHILLLLLVWLMRCHQHLIACRLVYSATTRHIRKLRLILIWLPSQLTTLRSRVNGSYMLWLGGRWGCTNSARAWHIRIWSILRELMGQYIILLVGLVSSLRYYLSSHHVQVVRRWWRYLWNLSESVLWALVLLTLPTDVLWASVTRLTLFASC